MKILTHITVFIAVLLSVIATATAVSSDIPSVSETQSNSSVSVTEYITESTSLEPKISSEVDTTVHSTEPVTEEMTEVCEATTVPVTTLKKETTVVTTTEKQIETTAAVKGEFFHITVYVPDNKWGYATATGVTSSHLQTCAVDPSVIPLGSTVSVNGLSLLACDTGNKVKGNVIDIFYDGTELEAQQWINSFGDYHTVIY